MKKALFILFILLLCVSQESVGQDKRLVVLDIGEGQSVLLQHGNRGVVFDTGHFGMYIRLSNSLSKYGVTEIDRVYLSHLHPDHASGIFGIMAAFPKAEVYESGARYPFNPHEDASRWVTEALDDGRWLVHRISQGHVQYWNGFMIETLWPPKQLKLSRNDGSLVQRISYGNSTVLIMGDAGFAVEDALIANGSLPEEVDVLVVGHHGAKDATSARFLDIVKPRYGVISVNNSNRRGYPSKKTIALLQESNVVVHLTYDGGDFIFPF